MTFQFIKQGFVDWKMSQFDIYSHFDWMGDMMCRDTFQLNFLILTWEWHVEENLSWMKGGHGSSCLSFDLIICITTLSIASFSILSQFLYLFWDIYFLMRYHLDFPSVLFFISYPFQCIEPFMLFFSIYPSLLSIYPFQPFFSTSIS